MQDKTHKICSSDTEGPRERCPQHLLYGSLGITCQLQLLDKALCKTKDASLPKRINGQFEEGFGRMVMTNREHQRLG